MAFRLNYQMKVATNFYNLFYHKILKINIHGHRSMTHFLGHGSEVKITSGGFYHTKRLTEINLIYISQLI